MTYQQEAILKLHQAKAAELTENEKAFLLNAALGDLPTNQADEVLMKIMEPK
ncbi:hypothetical protein L5186_002721 [Vibrio parahaemolyticus]|nr:hypothetical protein [Vibrio parahaemolyticus]EIU6754943.1 hypothetical protein [Vibrio parahaemolyticus]